MATVDMKRKVSMNSRDSRPRKANINSKVAHSIINWRNPQLRSPKGMYIIIKNKIENPYLKKETETVYSLISPQCKATVQCRLSELHTCGPHLGRPRRIAQIYRIVTKSSYRRAIQAQGNHAR